MQEKANILFLHGWGLRGSTYNKAIELLRKDGYQVDSIDLPGFGDEKLTNKTMNLSDYVEFVKKFIKNKKIYNVVLIGHSFGGRVSLKYVTMYPGDVEKLILTGVPIIRHMTPIKYIMYFAAIVGGRTFRIFPPRMQFLLRKSLYLMIGEWDYFNAGPRKEVFKNIVSEDLVQYAKNVKIPTLLLWGKHDTMTPVSDVKRIKEFIPQAKVVIVEGTGHKLPYEKPEEFIKHIKKFLHG